MTVLKSLQEKTMQDIHGTQSFVKRLSQRHREQSFELEWITPFGLLEKQNVKRYDIVVRDLAIGEMYGENDIGLYLWKKLGRRTRIPYNRRLVKLSHIIESFRKHDGFKVNGAIAVDEEYQQWGGSHRVALALRYNIIEIPILRRRGFHCRTKKRFRGVYDTRILRKCNYTEKEIEFIKALHYEYIRTYRKIEQIINKEREIFREG
jgi:hypothetical protein